MTVEQLGRILRDMYDEASDGEKVAHIHLFGVKYASQIRALGLTPREVILASGINASYGTELSKGMKLSRYVVPKA